MNNNKIEKSTGAQIKEIAVLLTIVFLIRTFGFGLYQVPTGSMETTMLVGERFFADKMSYLFKAPQRGDIISFNSPEFQYSDNKLINLYQQYVWGPINWTKRVIGVPGDHIKGVVEDGKPVVYRNGEKLDEPYTNKFPLIQVMHVDPIEFKMMTDRQKHESSSWRSFDESKPFVDQPFYDIQPQRILSKTQLRRPGTMMERYPDSFKRKRANGDYWNASDEFDIHLGPDEFWAMGDNRLGSHDCRVFGPIKRHLIHGKIVYRIWSIDSNSSWWIFDLLLHPIDFWKKVRLNRCLQWVS